ncbi:MAG: transcriptional regulator [Stenotrophobium sp.]
MSNEKAEFSKRLRTAMQAMQWSARPTVLEKKFNTRYTGQSVSFQTVSAWLGGRSIPQQDKLRVLADLLGMEPHHLRFGDQMTSKARKKQTVWPDTLNDRDRAAIDSLLALPAHRRKLIYDLIMTLAADNHS